MGQLWLESLQSLRGVITHEQWQVKRILMMRDCFEPCSSISGCDVVAQRHPLLRGVVETFCWVFKPTTTNGNLKQRDGCCCYYKVRQH